MLARIHSYLLQGIDALPCEVEIDYERTDINRRTIVGLPDAAVMEALERVDAALANSGYPIPRGHVVINLAPADKRKEGPVYDLPIAIGMLATSQVLRPEPDGIDPRRYLFAGELALDGRVRPVKGVIALASLAKSEGLEGVVVPAPNEAEAAVVDGLSVYGVHTLAEVVGLIAGQIEREPAAGPDVSRLLREAEAGVDFGDVRGQEAVKRALVIAAAGSHNVCMLGPAGSGKTMMAKALPGILPPLTPEEAIEITRIYSAAGALPPGCGLIKTRPVRSPHHTASSAAIVGGGIVPRPGEISLAHRGVLFLDELPEFSRSVLETLRQPLEDHVVTVARAHSSVRFPSSFMLVAAMNPTHQGDRGAGESGKRDQERYLSRLSGPLLDRIDIHVEAPAVAWKELSSKPNGTSTGTMRKQVLEARRIQNERQGPTTPNSRLTGRQLDELAVMSEGATTMLGQSLTEMGLSARAYDKLRRISRTIADLDGSEGIETGHVAEAVQYRLLDRRV